MNSMTINSKTTFLDDAAALERFADFALVFLQPCFAASVAVMIAAAGDQTQKRDKTVNFKEMTEEGLKCYFKLGWERARCLLE